MKRLAKTVAAVLTAAVTCVPLTQTAVAAPISNVNNNAVAGAMVSNQLENDVQILFTRYIVLHNDTFTVNEQNIIADGYGDHLQDFYNAASVLNVYSESGTARKQDRDLGGYTWCVLSNAVGLDVITSSVTKAISKAIQKADWKLAAGILVKVLGKTIVKKLGGPVGITIQLGLAAWNCRDKW